MPTDTNWPYLSVFGVLLACGLGLPVPEEVPLLTGGFFCHLGLTRLPFMIPIALAGVMGGDFILFAIGRMFGHRVMEHRFIRRLVRPSRLLVAESLLARHGVKIIFAARFLPGLRPMIFMAFGVLKVRFWKFSAMNGLAACVSVTTMVLLGKFFGHNLQRIQADVRTALHGLVLGVLVVGLAAAGVYLHRRQKRMMASAGVSRRVDGETLAHLPPGGGVASAGSDAQGGG